MSGDCSADDDEDGDDAERATSVMSMIADVVLIVVLKLLCDCDVVGCGELLCCVGY